MKGVNVHKGQQGKCQRPHCGRQRERSCQEQLQGLPAQLSPLSLSPSRRQQKRLVLPQRRQEQRGGISSRSQQHRGELGGVQQPALCPSAGPCPADTTARGSRHDHPPLTAACATQRPGPGGGAGLKQSSGNPQGARWRVPGLPGAPPKRPRCVPTSAVTPEARDQARPRGDRHVPSRHKRP